jgi:hypothetical protein
MTLGLSRVTCRLELHLKEVQTYLEEHPTPLVLSGQHMSGSWTAHLHKESKTQKLCTCSTQYRPNMQLILKF